MAKAPKAKMSPHACPECGSHHNTQKWKKTNRARRVCKDCHHIFTVYPKGKGPKDEEDDDIVAVLKKSSSQTRKILNSFKEFKNIPTDTIESRLIAKAILDMESPFSPASLKNSAREFISEKAKIYGVIQEGIIKISFIEPSLAGIMDDVEEESAK